MSERGKKSETGKKRVDREREEKKMNGNKGRRDGEKGWDGGVSDGGKGGERWTE